MLLAVSYCGSFVYNNSNSFVAGVYAFFVKVQSLHSPPKIIGDSKAENIYLPLYTQVSHMVLSNFGGSGTVQDKRNSEKKRKEVTFAGSSIYGTRSPEERGTRSILAAESTPHLA